MKNVIRTPETHPLTVCAMTNSRSGWMNIVAKTATKARVRR